jgi:hypothetical protein
VRTVHEWAGPWLLFAFTVAAWLATPGVAFAQLGSLLSPGQLHATHADLEGLTNCLQCHSQGLQVAADKCLSCHTPVAERIARRTGVHRAVTDDCVTCHVEHAGADADIRHFDQEQFDHARDGGWALDGLHAPLVDACADCHQTRSFLTADTSCVSCHMDPHEDSLGPECTSCHGVNVAFAAATTDFDHGRTAFPLAGAHQTVTCADCHPAKQYTDVDFASCASCHQDPHASSLGPLCSSCHTETSWRTETIDHDRTAFPLRDSHVSIECISCHVESATAVTLRSDSCNACHTDPHQGEFAEDCNACHTEASFATGTFDHATTRFSLTEGHAGLECMACHTTAPPSTVDFRGLEMSCDTCHVDVHRGELDTSCETCHSTSLWDVTTFTHADPRSFFEGRHAALSCVECHTETLQPTRTSDRAPVLRVGFTTTATACVSCHADVHLGQLQTNCQRCHSVETPEFAVTAFAHDDTAFPLTDKHAPLECASCHAVETGAFPAGHGSARRYTGVGTTCASCHEDPHEGQLDPACETCHSAEAFALPDYLHKRAGDLRTFFTGRHASATCTACHAALPGSRPGVPSAQNYDVDITCTVCHTDVHRGALGDTCETCHTP